MLWILCCLNFLEYYTLALPSYSPLPPHPTLVWKLKIPTSYFQMFLFFCGTGDWTQGRSTSALHPRPYFLYFILKPGLTKLRRASLSRERDGERERAEAGREPGSSRLCLPKYWDYKRAPPRPASLYFCFISESNGAERIWVGRGDTHNMYIYHCSLLPIRIQH